MTSPNRLPWLKNKTPLTIHFEWWDQRHGIILFCRVAYSDETFARLQRRPETREVRCS